MLCAQCGFNEVAAPNDRVCYDCASKIINRRQLDVNYIQKKAALPPYIYEATKTIVRAGQFIAAIKLVREWSLATTGIVWGLKESKDFIDYIRDHVLPKDPKF